MKSHLLHIEDFAVGATSKYKKITYKLEGFNHTFWLNKTVRVSTDRSKFLLHQKAVHEIQKFKKTYKIVNNKDNLEWLQLTTYSLIQVEICTARPHGCTNLTTEC